MLRRFALFFAALLLAPAAAWGQQTTNVVLETELGEIVIALETERAPFTAANFLRYVDEKRLDGTVFYRAMRLDWGEQPNGLIQGGTQYDPERILPPIAHERTNVTGVTHTVGAISMARNEPGSATGDFSIMLSPQPGLDADPASEDENFRHGYAAWLRTGLAAMASGIGAMALLEEVVEPWLAQASSVMLILLAEFCFVAGVWRQIVRAVPPPRPDTPAIPDWLLIVFNGFLLLLGGAVLVSILTR